MELCRTIVVDHGIHEHPLEVMTAESVVGHAYPQTFSISKLEVVNPLFVHPFYAGLSVTFLDWLVTCVGDKVTFSFCDVSYKFSG